MMASELEREAQQAITLIKSFSLELEQYSPESQVLYWLNQYRAPWIRDAIIEAVYQGRYKIISVRHILGLWQRRGQPVRHFTSGFEQVIAAQLGTPLHLSTSMLSTSRRSIAQQANDSKPSLTAIETAGTGNRVDISPSDINHGDYARLSIESIEAFPVEAKDTLVEVYQANTEYGEPIYVSNAASNESSLGDERTMYSSRYITSSKGKSSPIQPFRPQPLTRL